MTVPLNLHIQDLLNAVQGIQSYGHPLRERTGGVRLSHDVCQQISEAALKVEAALQEAKAHIPTVYVMGPTNVGKSTLLDVVRALPAVGLVEVGKMLRAKYPPEHFQGQAAPKHTAAEAIQMCLDGLTSCRDQGKRVAYVDGQPRDLDQLAKLCSIPSQRVFLILWAPEQVRSERAQQRDGNNPAKLELSMQRMRGDCVGLFDIMCHLQMRGEQVIVEDTSSDGYNVWETACMAASLAGVIL